MFGENQCGTSSNPSSSTGDNGDPTID